MKRAILTLFASTLFIVPAAFSQTQNQNQNQNHPNAEHHNRANAQQMVNRRVERLATIFDLTPDQKKQATTYFTSAWDANRPVMMQMRQDRKTLDSDIQAKADQSKLAADANALGQDQGKIIANNAEAQSHFFAMLNPQEQAKYEKLQATRFGGFGFAPGHTAPGAVNR